LFSPTIVPRYCDGSREGAENRLARVRAQTPASVATGSSAHGPTKNRLTVRVLAHIGAGRIRTVVACLEKAFPQLQVFSDVPSWAEGQTAQLPVHTFGDQQDPFLRDLAEER
jgi:hypothetical protein